MLSSFKILFCHIIIYTLTYKITLLYILDIQWQGLSHNFYSVEVHLQATGDAPIMKQKKYKVDGEKRIDWIIAFIRKFLKLEPTDSLVSN